MKKYVTIGLLAIVIVVSGCIGDISDLVENDEQDNINQTAIEEYIDQKVNETVQKNIEEAKNDTDNSEEATDTSPILTINTINAPPDENLDESGMCISSLWGTTADSEEECEDKCGDSKYNKYYWQKNGNNSCDCEYECK